MVASREWTGEEPGLRSVAIDIGTFFERSAATGGSLLFAEVIEGTRQQHGDRARGRDGIHALLVEIFDVVDRERAIAGGEFCAAEVGELLGMKLDGQAMRLGGAENLLGLGDREGDALAEGVDRIGKPGLGRGGQGLLADEADVVGAPVS